MSTNYYEPARRYGAAVREYIARRDRVERIIEGWRDLGIIVHPVATS